MTEIARQTGIDVPAEGDMKQILTTGKNATPYLIGEAGILKAMRTNEEDTVTAYERASAHPEAIDKSRAFFEKTHADELRHRQWMQTTAEAM